MDVFKDHDPSGFGDEAALKVSEALHQSVHGLIPFVPSCSSIRSRRATISTISIALATLPTRVLSDAASPGVMSPDAVASVSAAAAVSLLDDLLRLPVDECLGEPRGVMPRALGLARRRDRVEEPEIKRCGATLGGKVISRKNTNPRTWKDQKMTVFQFSETQRSYGVGRSGGMAAPQVALSPDPQGRLGQDSATLIQAAAAAASSMCGQPPQAAASDPICTK
jgi:hypothetical protein